VIEAAGGSAFVPGKVCLRSNAKTIEVSFDGQYHSTLKATAAAAAAAAAAAINGGSSGGSNATVEGFQAEEVFVKKSVVQRISLKVFLPFFSFRSRLLRFFSLMVGCTVPFHCSQ